MVLAEFCERSFLAMVIVCPDCLSRHRIGAATHDFQARCYVTPKRAWASHRCLRIGQPGPEPHTTIDRKPGPANARPWWFGVCLSCAGDFGKYLATFSLSDIRDRVVGNGEVTSGGTGGPSSWGGSRSTRRNLKKKDLEY